MIDKLNKLTTREKPKQPQKPESKLWQAALGMSKNEAINVVAKDLNNYMTLASFNLQSVKQNLNETGMEKPGTAKTIAQEFKFVRDYSVNSMYNFYSDGALRKFVRRVQGEQTTSAEQIRIKFYVALLTTAITYAFWPAKKPVFIE